MKVHIIIERFSSIGGHGYNIYPYKTRAGAKKVFYDWIMAILEEQDPADSELIQELEDNYDSIEEFKEQLKAGEIVDFEYSSESDYYELQLKSAEVES